MIDVIIPAYILDEEKLQYLREAVFSLRQTNGGVKIIIIDNGSFMGHGELREMSDLYVLNKTNIEYAGAVNQGLKLSGEIVCVANDDIKVPPHWADVAFDILQDQTVGSVHYRMIPYNQLFNHGKDTWKSGREKWCSSSFFVVRNKILFDTNYHSGVEDWDYWKRFRELGYTTAYTNKAEYQHADSATLQRLPSNSENQKKNIEYFISKWGMTPEEDFERLHPGQLAQPWKPMP